MDLRQTCLFENLKIYHVNCQSLFAYLEEFRSYFTNSNYHIICMSETWLRPEIGDDLVSLPGYVLFRRDRIGRIGGSVAFFLSTSLHARVLMEFLVVDLSFS